MGGQGLKGICGGLEQNITLTSLSMADNGVAATDEDIDALETLARLVMRPESLLASVDLLYNRIGEKGGEAMLKVFNGGKLEGGGPPKKVSQLLVDATLPQQLFDSLCRIDAAGGGKKGSSRPRGFFSSFRRPRTLVRSSAAFAHRRLRRVAALVAATPWLFDRPPIARAVTFFFSTQEER